MRVLKSKLDSGITTILVTNIFDKDFSVADFKKLYFKRSGIEVKYNGIKNKLQIENFTGETPIAIEQGFLCHYVSCKYGRTCKIELNR